jgi:hypothetical protein
MDKEQIMTAYRKIQRLLNIEPQEADAEEQLPVYSRNDGDFFEFISKGQLIIQLPKSKYLKRKRMLDKGVYKIKNQLREIRSTLMPLNLD